MTQPIIDPIDPSLIEPELTPERLLRRSNKGGNLIYTLDGRECPATMRDRPSARGVIQGCRRRHR